MRKSDRPSRHLAEYLPDPYHCPENQDTGCEGCSGEIDCWKELHNADNCWNVLNYECPICLEEAREGDRGDYLYEQEKDKRMMEGE